MILKKSLKLNSFITIPIKEALKKPIFRFFIKVFLLYVGWYLLYDLWLHPKQFIDIFVINVTVASSKLLLNLIGYEVFTSGSRLLGIDGTNGLWIGDACNGIVLFALFAGFIIAFPGKVRIKVPFIIAGILLLQIANIIRVVALAIIQFYAPLQPNEVDWTEFNHTYTFTILIYGLIFYLWMLWANKYSKY